MEREGQTHTITQGSGERREILWVGLTLALRSWAGKWAGGMGADEKMSGLDGRGRRRMNVDRVQAVTRDGVPVDCLVHLPHDIQVVLAHPGVPTSPSPHAR